MISTIHSTRVKTQKHFPVGRETKMTNRTSQIRKALLCYFSYTGYTRTVAKRLNELLRLRYHVDLLELTPKKSRPYLIWLIYSFLPNSRVAINDCISDLTGYDLVCLGAPKWTFSCPPFNEYLDSLSNGTGKKLALFITYGGFRKQDFVRRIVNSLERKGVASIHVLMIRRRMIANGSYLALVDDFASHL